MPEPHRRALDKDPIMKWYEKNRAYIHIVGVVLLGAFTVGVYATKFDANAATVQQHTQDIHEIQVVLASHEKEFAESHAREDVMNQKLDDMIAYFNIPNRPRCRHDGHDPANCR